MNSQNKCGTLKLFIIKSRVMQHCVLSPLCHTLTASNNYKEANMHSKNSTTELPNSPVPDTMLFKNHTQ